MATIRKADYDVGMSTDLLTIAAQASEVLEGHGLVACGRRQDGITSVDFWTRDGASYRHELERADLTVDEVVAACLAIAGLEAPPPPVRGRACELN